jgi:hypothetical protein
MSNRILPRAAGGGTPSNPTAVAQAAPSTATIATVDVGQVAVALLLANPKRQGAIFWNDGPTGSVFIALGTPASDTVFTVKIAPGSFYELKFPVFTGFISAISDLLVGSAAVRVTELLP